MVRNLSTFVEFYGWLGAIPCAIQDAVRNSGKTTVLVWVRRPSGRVIKGTRRVPRQSNILPWRVCGQPLKPPVYSHGGRKSSRVTVTHEIAGALPVLAATGDTFSLFFWSIVACYLRRVLGITQNCLSKCRCSPTGRRHLA